MYLGVDVNVDETLIAILCPLDTLHRTLSVQSIANHHTHEDSLLRLISCPVALSIFSISNLSTFFPCSRH